MSYEQQLLSALEAISVQQANMAKQQAEQAVLQESTCKQLAALASHQETTSAQVAGMQQTLKEIFKELAKEPSGESLKETMEGLLEPLNRSMQQLVTSFNSLADISTQLADRLPPQPKS